MARGLALGLGAVVVFALVAGIMFALMPMPLKNSDYMVIGSVGTLAALGVVFVVWMSTTMKSADVFFKKRKK
jgi:hypothetical protein